MSKKLAIIVVLLLAIGLIYVILANPLHVNLGQATANIVGGNNNGESLNQNCQQNPTVALALTDALQPGTIVEPTSNYTQLGGNYVGTNPPTNPTAGLKLDMLFSKAGYLGKSFMGVGSDNGKVACGPNIVRQSLYAYQAPSVKVYSGYDNSLLTNAVLGGAHNETNSATPITEKITLTEAQYKSSGQLLFVIDFYNKTQVAVSGISLSGTSSTNVPAIYSAANLTASGSQAAFLDTSPLIGGTQNAVRDYYLTLTPQSGKTIGNLASSVNITVYGLQDGFDYNGNFLSNQPTDSLGSNLTAGQTGYGYLII